MRYILNSLIIFVGLLLLWIVITGGGRYYFGGVKLGLRHTTNPSIIFVILCAIRVYFFADISILPSTNTLYQYAVRNILFFILATLTIKTYITLLSIFYFQLTISSYDLLYTFSTDLSLALLALLICLFSHWSIKNFDRSGVASLIGFVGTFSMTFLLVMSFFSAALYVIIAYVYFEWVSFLEPQHFAAMQMAGVGAEAVYFFFRWPTLFVFLTIITLWKVASRINTILFKRKKMYRPVIAISFFLLPSLLTVHVPLFHPEQVAPSVQSPVLMLFRPISGNSDGIVVDPLLETYPSGNRDYRPEPYDKEIKPQFQKLSGIAEGMNVIIFVMESVRRRNLDLYGYPRVTMPTLTKLSNHGIVFDRGYVTQPRSSKTYTAIALGETPDPRLTPLSFEKSRVKGKKSFLSQLIIDGRRYYIGTTQPDGSDKMEVFFNAVSGDRADRITSYADLVNNRTVSNDDIGLSQDFLQWVEKDEQPFLSILWTECAHMPYNAPSTPFGTSSLMDKYDNCIRTVDSSLKELVDGLQRIGKMDNTLLVIFGDHGEALGEKFDNGHGNYLYEHSLRIPVVIFNPTIFNTRIDVDHRFQVKDIPSTVLYLLGKPDKLNQSINIFSKDAMDTLYFSNVYQDFKLGMLDQDIKFVYRPVYDLTTVYDIANDPDEMVNVVNRYSREELAEMKNRTLQWYRFHTRYLDKKYPKK